MEKLKIAITLAGYDDTSRERIQNALDEPAMHELCTPVVMDEKEALRKLEESTIDAVVLAQKELATCPADALEVIVTDKTNIILLAKEPEAEDIVKLRDILERDFDFRSPRLAIAVEQPMQNPELASQVTNEQGINTYGPYTLEQLLAEDKARHFDGIVTTDKALAQRIITATTEEAPVRFFAGRDTIVTAIYKPVQMDEEDGLADVSWLTHPFFVATDVIRNRAFYDEARQNPLPKLFRDKRDDRKKDEAPQANSDNDEKGQPS